MSQQKSSQITLGGGCFWCIEAVYLELDGINHVESGYAGGTKPNPNYQEVCSGNTGHAEVVQVTFDPSIITIKEVLQIFFTVHDPTTLNRQGADIGSQYRSIVLYHDENQKKIAQDLVKELEDERIWTGIVTEIVPLSDYYKAEDYHQNYYNRNPNQGYCRAVINPKLYKFRKIYKEKLKKGLEVKV